MFGCIGGICSSVGGQQSLRGGGGETTPVPVSDFPSSIARPDSAGICMLLHCVYVLGAAMDCKLGLYFIIVLGSSLACLFMYACLTKLVSLPVFFCGV